MADRKPIILIVEDDEDMLLGLKHNFEYEGYETTTASSGRVGREKALLGTADLVVLDVMLPEINGFDILREMRERMVRTPVILLTSKGLEADKLEGFSLGADDYVTKPFSIQELLARVRAVLQRTKEQPEPDTTYRIGEVEVDFEHQTMKRGGESLSLALKEFELLHLLVRNRGQIVTREQMLCDVWGYRPDAFPETRTVDNHIAKLRQKIGSEFIETVPKRGYRFLG